MGMDHNGAIDACECEDCQRRRGWLDELERLEAAVSAISGDWETGGPYPSVSVITCVDGGSWGECPDPPIYEPICQIHTDSRPDAPPPPESAVLLARFIALIRNHAPALIASAKRCEELERQLADARKHADAYHALGRPADYAELRRVLTTKGGGA